MSVSSTTGVESDRLNQCFSDDTCIQPVSVNCSVYLLLHHNSAQSNFAIHSILVLMYQFATIDWILLYVNSLLLLTTNSSFWGNLKMGNDHHVKTRSHVIREHYAMFQQQVGRRLCLRSMEPSCECQFSRFG
ncbi:hypothetical protein BC833DRAFT_568219 [Globomyces pollinis-pini]|nr:hypothetical protein BC833DRAFT_568219 [Globomyces pollinis-pini]